MCLCFPVMCHNKNTWYISSVLLEVLKGMLLNIILINAFPNEKEKCCQYLENKMICSCVALFLYYLVFKVLKKLFATRLNCFLRKYEVISNSQYGFKANTSTSHALADADIILRQI